MRALLRLIAFVSAVAMLGYGLLSGSDYVLSANDRTPPGYDNTWLLMLYLSTVPIGYLLFSMIPRQTVGWRRNAWKISAVLVVGFIIVSLQLLRQQFVVAPALANRPVLTETSPDRNPRIFDQQLRTQRGRVFDRNGVELAGRVVGVNGYVQRSYPEPAASYLIGYYSPGLYERSGLEEKYNDYLSGEEGDPIEETRSRLLRRPAVGSDLRLTLDIELQKRAEEILGDRRGAVILMNPKTGEVLAMVTNPAFNAADLAFDPQKPLGEERERIQGVYADLTSDPEAARLVNRATQGLYNPGSTFKTVTGAAALDLGVAQPDQRYYDDGTFEVGGFVINDPNRPDKRKLRWTFEEGYAHSLNAVFAQIGLDVKSAGLREYGARFGFEEPIPFDLRVTPSELERTPGFLSDRVALASTAFGQGQLSVTPMQVLLTAATIANGGELPRPYLVSEIKTPSGGVALQQGRSVIRRVVSPEVAAQMTDVMVAAVDYGSAKLAKVDGVEVAGKTGTAELGEDEDPHAWFTGFAPANNPQVAVVVLVENGGFGSQVAAPLGGELLEAALERRR